MPSVESSNQLVDIFTIGVASKVFASNVNDLGMINIGPENSGPTD